MPVLWLPEVTQASLYGLSAFNPQLVSKYGTKRGIYKSKLIGVGMGEEETFKEKAEFIKDRIIIVSTDLCFDINGLFAEYAAAAAVEKLAEEYGAKGIVFMSSRGKGLLYRFITSKGTDVTIPQFVMSREDAKRIVRLIEQGKHVEIEI